MARRKINFQGQRLRGQIRRIPVQGNLPLTWLLREATTILTQAGCDTPRLDAELLLAEVLGCERGWLLAHPEAQVEEAQTERFCSLVERRAKREPLPYILGRAEFYGLTFKVDRRVLIPRPETELLVEKALEWISNRDAASSAPARDLTIADVGTGSGAIAVTLAVLLSKGAGTARAISPLIYALDSSSEALSVAQENARLHGVEGHIAFLQSHLLGALPEPVDLIVANLPYVPSRELGSLMPEVAWEPQEALDGGPDGLEKIRALLHQAPSRLAEGGAIFLEIGPGQAEKVKSLALESFPGAQVKAFRDYRGIERVMCIFWDKIPPSYVDHD
ncbi:MAG: peptide chain release factor N(5)-glutamine methyltransferase [Chloroflexi bacterium]|nr:MAG: peptide chain release factor N(5)-glutamine methyltransferase [Chloroflexota bacterium]